MTHVQLERAIVKFIESNLLFNCPDLYISSDDENGNSEIIAYINNKPRQCRPDIIAHNFWGEKFQIYRISRNQLVETAAPKAESTE